MSPPQAVTGWCCIVTRAQPQAAAQVSALRSLGLQAQALPLLCVGPAPDPAVVQAAWATLAQQHLVMFVSANAVQHFFALRPSTLSAWPEAVRAAGPGRGTLAALRAQGVPATACVAPAADAVHADSEALWDRLQREPWRGRHVLIVRGESGRDWLAETFRAHGAQVRTLAAYTRGAPVLDPASQALLRQALAQPAQHLWLLASAEGVDQLRALAPDSDWGGAQALAPHPRIAAAARAAGFGAVAEVPADADAVAQWVRQHPCVA